MPSLYQVSLGGGTPTAGQSSISVLLAMTVGSNTRSVFLIFTGTVITISLSILHM